MQLKNILSKTLTLSQKNRSNSQCLTFKFKFNKLKNKNFIILDTGSLDSSKGVNFIIKLQKDTVNKYYIYGGSEQDVSKLKRNSK